MAKKQQVEAETFDGIRLRITQAQLDAAIDMHKAALETLIKTGTPRPLDGDACTLIRTIDALSTRIIAADDPAGRGLGIEDKSECL